MGRTRAGLRLNVTALCALTHLFLQEMVARKHGRILNVASTAGFIPGPLQAVYYATKAFVVSFSQAIAEELSDTNVTVTALCPGPLLLYSVGVPPENDWVTGQVFGVDGGLATLRGTSR